MENDAAFRIISLSGPKGRSIEVAYPGRFKKMGIRSFGTGDWQGEQGHIHAKEALEWLIYEKLKLTVEEIPYRIGSNTFRQYGLGGMFSEVFHRSVAKALEIVYPGRFTTLDLQRAKHNQARRN